VQTLAWCTQHRLPHYIIGAGFNLLALDEPIAGVVLQLGKMRLLEERPNGGLRAEAGVSHSQVTRFCVDRGLSGLEFACGIPGTVGGWIAMNAGVPGREMRDAVREIEVLSPTGRKLQHISRGDLSFTYRALRGLAPGSVIVSALFEVSVSVSEKVRAEVDQLLARRSATQPLNVPSCGSVFKNPPGDFAGRLIEAAGLKGTRRGGAEISRVHANFIANVGGASATDILGLIDEARDAVWQSAGTWLVPEVRTLGGGA
jgi:UDP-N-acetylmuramate dehydrogenase